MTEQEWKALEAKLKAASSFFLSAVQNGRKCWREVQAIVSEFEARKALKSPSREEEVAQALFDACAPRRDPRRIPPQHLAYLLDDGAGFYELWATGDFQGKIQWLTSPCRYEIFTAEGRRLEPARRFGTLTKAALFLAEWQGKHLVLRGPELPIYRLIPEGLDA